MLIAPFVLLDLGLPRFHTLSSEMLKTRLVANSVIGLRFTKLSSRFYYYILLCHA